MGVASRLVLLRNVDYIIEQQKLETRASFERQLTNTLSHELLTPLNCIINVSESLYEDFKIKTAHAEQNKRESQQALRIYDECV